MNERVQSSGKVGFTVRSDKSDEPPEREDGRMVIQVQEGDLTVVLFQHHNYLEK
jgi:hypothetical protein